jgi:hypothetical protein
VQPNGVSRLFPNGAICRRGRTQWRRKRSFARFGQGSLAHFKVPKYIRFVSENV